MIYTFYFKGKQLEIGISLPEILLAFLIIIMGAILQGSIGFGLGPFAVPLLLLINPLFVPGPVLLIALSLTILMYKRDKFAVNKNEIKWAVIGRLLGTIIGAFVLLIISKDHLSLLFAIVILLSLVIFISGIKLRLTDFNLIVVGIMSGFMGTTASIGGPPMGMLYQNEKGPRIRGTLSGIFMIGTILAIVSLLIIKKLWITEFTSIFDLNVEILCLVSKYVITAKINLKGIIALNVVRKISPIIVFSGVKSFQIFSIISSNIIPLLNM